MDSSFDNQTQKIFDTLKSKLSKDASGFVVGGAVRDVLFNRTIHDFDIAYNGAIKPYAKRVADSLGASFFVLNEQFQTSRIVSTGPKQFSIDIVGMRGNSIEDDLGLRDFTINAIAFDLSNPGQLIDPFNGVKDLDEKRLRACSDSSFRDDPIRILRAIRQSILFGLRIDKETKQLMKDSINDIRNVTKERIRDEFMRMLDLPSPVIAINILDIFNILHIILPEVDSTSLKKNKYPETDTSLWETIILTMKNLIMLEHLLIGDYVSGGALTLRGGEAVLHLGRYRYELKKLLANRLHQDRNIRSLMFMAVLLLNANRLTDQDFINEGKPGKLRNSSKVFLTSAKNLTLTNKEAKWVNRITSGIKVFHDMASEFTANRGDLIYRYFRTMEECGLLSCLLGLSETLNNESISTFEEQWYDELLFSKALMEAYWEKSAIYVNPPIFINGDEIKNKFIDIKPDQIGHWIERISEATAAGLIHNKSEAFRYLEDATDFNLNKK